MEPRETDRGAFAPEVVAQTGGESLRLLSGQMLLLNDRLRRVEDRVQQLDARQTQYMDSIHNLRTHFDGELATMKSTQQSLIATVGDVRTLVVQINGLLRQEDNGLSLLAWRQMTEVWIKDHALMHKQVQERTWKVGLDVAARVFLWLVAGAVAVLAARGFMGKL